MRESFPNNEDRRSFRLYRRINRSSKALLSDTAKSLDLFPRHGIKPKPIGRVALTIMGKGTIMNARKYPGLQEMLFPDFAAALLEPSLESARRPISAEVEGVGVFGVSVHMARLALRIQDKNGALEEEYNTYFDRLAEVGEYDVVRRQFVPHLTIATVDPTCATNELLERLEKAAPRSVLLLPVGTDPRVPKNLA